MSGGEWRGLLLLFCTYDATRILDLYEVHTYKVLSLKEGR